MTKKMTKRSQFVRDLNYPSKAEVIWQSQMGEGYALAELGSLNELLDRLAKYDLIDAPLNKEVAQKAINKFISHIEKCEFLDDNEAFAQLNMKASVGFGAKRAGVLSREDAELHQYLSDYIERTVVQPHHVFIAASQKDEMRAFENGILKTPRLFMSYPVEQTYLSTIVLSDFLRQVYLSSFFKDFGVSSVGDAPQLGAYRYYQEELSKRPYLYCTDTSGQDASVPAEFLEMVYDSIQKLYDLDSYDQSLFEGVRLNSIHKMLNVNGYVYLLRRGLASGDYLTIVINMMWRLYLAYTSYHYPLEQYHEHNTTVICGDDFMSSSDYADLNHDSKYAKITWAGRPVGWDEMDFCSCKFSPNIHHDPKKVESVLYGRVQARSAGDPNAEMQRLAGLLRVHADRATHKLITNRMLHLCDKHGLVDEFNSLWVPYWVVYQTYNCYLQFD